MLGLTATPERADGRSIYAYFEGRIAAEIRLWEAIERKLLSPFHYFGVTDNIDLSQVRWVAGKYDEREIENLYVFERAVAVKRVVEDEGVYAGVCDEEDGESLIYIKYGRNNIFLRLLNIKEQGVPRVDAERLVRQ